MRRPVRILGVLVGVFVLLNGAAFLLIESGEVVVLRSEAENRLLARLWVVDHEGHPWVGTANPSKTRWVGSLREHPTIRLTRGDTMDCRRAVYVDDRSIGEILGALVSAKYRVPLYGSYFLKFTQGDRLDDAEEIWFRLEPCSDSGANAAQRSDRSLD